MRVISSGHAELAKIVASTTPSFPLSSPPPTSSTSSSLLSLSSGDPLYRANACLRPFVDVLVTTLSTGFGLTTIFSGYLIRSYYHNDFHQVFGCGRRCVCSFLACCCAMEPGLESQLGYVLGIMSSYPTNGL